MTRPPFYPFQSERARAEYAAHSQARGREWPIPCETRLLETPSGQTFVRISGRSGDPPLVLLPGARVSSLMWTHSIEALSAHHRTFALDVIGDVGWSVNRDPIRTPADYTRWLHDVLAVLVPEGQLGLVGLSLGGAIAAQYALHHPERLQGLVLVAPGGTVLPLSTGFFVRLTLLSLPIPGRGGNLLRRVCEWLFEDAVHGDEASRRRFEEAIDELQRAFRAFALPRPPWPATFGAEEWGELRVPCLFLVGEHEKIYSAEAAVRRLRRIAPRVQTEILPGVGHDLTIVSPDLVAERILEFLSARDGHAADVLVGTAPR